jgi:hypothetical protein
MIESRLDATSLDRVRMRRIESEIAGEQSKLRESRRAEALRIAPKRDQ